MKDMMIFDVCYVVSKSDWTFIHELTIMSVVLSEMKEKRTFDQKGKLSKAELRSSKVRTERSTRIT